MKEVLSKEEKLKKLRKIAEALAEKEAEKGAGVTLGFLGDEHMQGVGVFELMPIGIPSIDAFLGGGVPKGGHIMVAGPPDSGKTTTMLNLIARAQANGLVCGFADFEGKFDAPWAQKQGVNIQELAFGQFEVAEAGFEWIRDASSYCDIIVVDSMTALASRQMKQTKKGVDKDFDDQTMGVLARLVNQYLRITQPTVVKNKNTVLMINHLYNKMDIHSTKTTGGGDGMKYFEILELWMSRSKPTDEALKEVAFNLKLTAKKGHYTGAPKPNTFMETLFFLNEGFNLEYEYVQKAYVDNFLYTEGSKTIYVDSKGEIHEVKGTSITTVFKNLKEKDLIKDIVERYSLTEINKKNMEVPGDKSETTKSGRKKKSSN